jgi:type VI protein secretion system component Hcp
MAIYMQYGAISGAPTAPAPGRGTTRGQGAFEIKDFSFGVENPTTIGSATGGAGAGKIKFNEFSIGKTVDSASPSLWRNATSGSRPRYGIAIMKPTGTSSHNLFRGQRLDVSIVFAYCAPGGPPSPGPRHTLNLSGAVITDIEHSYRGEEVTISFSNYYFNGAWNVPPQTISLITAPFTAG